MGKGGSWVGVVDGWESSGCWGTEDRLDKGVLGCWVGADVREGKRHAAEGREAPGAGGVRGTQGRPGGKGVRGEQGSNKGGHGTWA